MSGRIRAAEPVLQRTLLDGVLLLPPAATEPLHLNPSAAEIWSMLDAPTSTGEIATALARRHGGPADGYLAAVTGVVDDLDEAGAVHQLTGPSA